MRFLASSIFGFLEKHDGCIIERHEINNAAFRVVRQNIRQIVFGLHDPDDPQAFELSGQLRVLLSEWLTVPVRCDDSMRNTMTDLLGRPDELQARWGRDIRQLYEIACRSIGDLAMRENPMRDELRSIIREMRSNRQTFRIYCHRCAQPHFESLVDPVVEPQLHESIFIHSVRDYRECEPFDALIKVGPLRSRGWGCAPDALITAPRFGTLAQVVWAGCGDEPNFGYDPVVSRPGASSSLSRPRWVRRTIQIGIDPEALEYGAVELDELQAFRDLVHPHAQRAATLVLVDEDSGILYPPHAQVLSFDPSMDDQDAICRRILGDTLVEGMYIVRPLIDDVDLGGTRAEHGHNSRIWKDRLEREWKTDAAGLSQRLRDAGLSLVHLEAAVRHWCKAPSTVIHAPQRRRHFEILIEVLGLAGELHFVKGREEQHWWKMAWLEIRRSRGDAIQAGVQEREIVDEQVLAILISLLDQIREGTKSDTGFNLPIPGWSDVHGQFLFHKISGIESGLRVPESELKVIREIGAFDQWRS